MAPTAPTTRNYSILSIPAYMLITMAPHIYSSTLLTTNSTPPTAAATQPSGAGTKSQLPKSIYNLPNPRSSHNNQKYSTALPRATYERWERARAAHANMLENAAFFVSAVLAGVVTKCDASYMNRVAGWYLLSRVLYTIAYVTVSRGPLAWGRTVFYMAGNGLLASLWWEATQKIWTGAY